MLSEKQRSRMRRKARRRWRVEARDKALADPGDWNLMLRYVWGPPRGPKFWAPEKDPFGWPTKPLLVMVKNGGDDSETVAIRYGKGMS